MLDISEVADTLHITWVDFRHWDHFPLVSDLATLSHHHYPDNFPLFSLPSGCFHFTPPSFLHGPSIGEDLVRLQRLREGSLPQDSNGCSCKAAAAKASRSVLQKFDVLMWGSQGELQPTLSPFPQKHQSLQVPLGEAGSGLGLVPFTALSSIQKEQFSIHMSHITTTKTSFTVCHSLQQFISAIQTHCQQRFSFWST